MVRLLVLLLLSLMYPHTDGQLLESGRGANLRKPASAPSEIRVVTYNIRWRSGDELRDIIKLLQDDPEVGGATILALQEVDRHKKRSGNSNTAKMIADRLGLHYVWAAPPATRPTDEEETGVALLSVYPLSDVRRIVLPHPGPNGRRRVALGASVEIGHRRLRVYSAHAETRIPLDKKMEQYKALIEDLSHYPANMPAIIMGDLNTWQPGAGDRTIKVFTDAGLKTPFGAEATFKRRVLFVPIELKLDWVWLRGLEASAHGIDRAIEISDHWPLWTNIKLQNQ